MFQKSAVFGAAFACACASGTQSEPRPAPAPAPAQPLEPTPQPSVVQPSPAQPLQPENPPTLPGLLPGGPRERPLPGAVWPPPGHPRETCALEIATTVRARGPSYEVRATAKNVSKERVSFELPNRCPNGPIAFAGLPAGYDYYQGCNKGACIDNGQPLRFVVEPGKTIELASATITPGSGCQAALAPGRYEIAFALPPEAHACAARFGAIEYKLAEKRATPPPPSKPAKKCPPMPACGIACPGGNFAHDENGCSLCACDENWGVGPITSPGP